MKICSFFSLSNLLITIVNSISFRYNKDGHNVGTPEFAPPTPSRLQWDLDAKCIQAIEQSYRVII